MSIPVQKDYLITENYAGFIEYDGQDEPVNPNIGDRWVKRNSDRSFNGEAYWNGTSWDTVVVPPLQSVAPVKKPASPTPAAPA